MVRSGYWTVFMKKKTIDANSTHLDYRRKREVNNVNLLSVRLLRMLKEYVGSVPGESVPVLLDTLLSATNINAIIQQ